MTKNTKDRKIGKNIQKPTKNQSYRHGNFIVNYTP